VRDLAGGPCFGGVPWKVAIQPDPSLEASGIWEM